VAPMRIHLPARCTQRCTTAAVARRLGAVTLTR
jgi:hypothetical protein